MLPPPVSWGSWVPPGYTRSRATPTCAASRSSRESGAGAASTRSTRRASSSTSTPAWCPATEPPRCTCCPRSSRSSAGASAACACRAGTSTSRAAGAPAPARSTTRWRCCARGTAACRWPSSPRTARATPTARRRSAACSPGCCAASARREHARALSELDQRLADLAPRAVLRHEAVHPRLAPHGRGAVGAHQDEPRRKVRMPLAQQLAHRRAEQPSHAHVDQRQVGLKRLDRVESLVAALHDRQELEAAVPRYGARQSFPVSTLVIGEDDGKGARKVQHSDGRAPAASRYPLPVGASAVSASSARRSYDRTKSSSPCGPAARRVDLRSVRGKTPPAGRHEHHNNHIPIPRRDFVGS